jgi:hypothetical protein
MLPVPRACPGAPTAMVLPATVTDWPHASKVGSAGARQLGRLTPACGRIGEHVGPTRVLSDTRTRRTDYDRVPRDCVIRRKTDTGSDAKRTMFRSYPDKVPAESGRLS